MDVSVSCLPHHTFESDKYEAQVAEVKSIIMDGAAETPAEEVARLLQQVRVSTAARVRDALPHGFPRRGWRRVRHDHTESPWADRVLGCRARWAWCGSSPARSACLGCQGARAPGTLVMLVRSFPHRSIPTPSLGDGTPLPVLKGTRGDE